MAELPKKRCVKCPNCGDIFTIERGLQTISSQEGAERRREKRVPVINMRILVGDSLREFPIKNMSRSGMGFLHEGWVFDQHQVLTFDLIEEYRIIIKGVKAKVTRVGDKSVGCIYDNLASDVKTKLFSLASSLKLKRSRTIP